MPEVAAKIRDGKVVVCNLTDETYNLFYKLVRKERIGFEGTLIKAWEHYGEVSEGALVKYIKRRYPIWYSFNSSL